MKKPRVGNRGFDCEITIVILWLMGSTMSPFVVDVAIKRGFWLRIMESNYW